MDTKNNITARLASASVPKLLISLAIPSVIAQIVNLLYNIVDRIYIGHMDSADSTALTGVGLCFPIICLIGAFTMLIAQGGAPRAAIFMGKGDNKSAQRILGGCFSALIAMAAVLTAVFLIFSERLLWLFGASDDTIGYALDYINIYTVGSIFVMISLGLNLFISTQGFTLFSMATVLIGAGLNILLDPLFIFVFDMGVRGAAIATVIAQGASALWTILFLTGKKTKLKLTFYDMKPDMKLLLPCLGLGLAPFVIVPTAIYRLQFLVTELRRRYRCRHNDRCGDNYADYVDARTRHRYGRSADYKLQLRSKESRKMHKGNKNHAYSYGHIFPHLMADGSAFPENVYGYFLRRQSSSGKSQSYPCLPCGYGLFLSADNCSAGTCGNRQGKGITFHCLSS